MDNTKHTEHNFYLYNFSGHSPLAYEKDKLSLVLCVIYGFYLLRKSSHPDTAMFNSWTLKNSVANCTFQVPETMYMYILKKYLKLFGLTLG